MTGECCPECGQEVLATVIRGPTAITVLPCGHEIVHIEELTDARDLGSVSPGEWLTRLLADSDNDQPP